LVSENHAPPNKKKTRWKSSFWRMSGGNAQRRERDGISEEKRGAPGESNLERAEKKKGEGRSGESHGKFVRITKR